jgi:hypothetical protein
MPEEPDQPLARQAFEKLRTPKSTTQFTHRSWNLQIRTSRSRDERVFERRDAYGIGLTLRHGVHRDPQRELPLPLKEHGAYAPDVGAASR